MEEEEDVAEPGVMRDGADDEARYEDAEDRRRGCREWVGTGGNMPIDPMRRPPVRPSTSRIVIGHFNKRTGL